MQAETPAIESRRPSQERAEQARAIILDRAQPPCPGLDARELITLPKLLSQLRPSVLDQPESFAGKDLAIGSIELQHLI